MTAANGIAAEQGTPVVEQDSTLAEQPAEDRRRRAVAALVLAVVVGFLIWWLLQYVALVPTTIGMSRGRSVQLIEEAGFEADVTTVTAGPRPVGRIVSQSPAGGWAFTWWPVHVTATVGGDVPAALTWPTTTTDSADFTLELSAGIDDTVLPVDAEEMDPLHIPVSSERLMPNVQNVAEAAAKDEVRDVGLGVTVKRGPSTTDVGGGRVYFQDPAPGDPVVIGQRATIWVSSGPFDMDDGDHYPYPRPKTPGAD